MTTAFNLSQLANNVNSSGQLNATTGLYNSAPSSVELQTLNFTIKQVGSKLCFYNGTTLIASIDASGNIVALGNVTAYGTP
jgi:hypothetical protein